MADKAKIQAMVLEYLERKAPVPGETPEERLAYAYVDKGHVSSFEILELVLTLEEALGVRLEPEEMQSPGFRTVGGLVEIMHRLASA